MSVALGISPLITPEEYLTDKAAVLRLDAIECELPAAEIYDGVL